MSVWDGVLEHAGFGSSDLIQLHHLTPMHEAAARLWPQRSLITHLHGTELRMLDRIARLEAAAVALGTSFVGLPLAAGCVLTHGSDEGRGPAERRIDRDFGRFLASNQLQDRGIVNTDGERLDRCLPITPREETDRRLLRLGGEVDA